MIKVTVSHDYSMLENIQTSNQDIDDETEVTKVNDEEIHFNQMNNAVSFEHDTNDKYIQFNDGVNQTFFK